jgi:hypothetical protein
MLCDDELGLFWGGKGFRYIREIYLEDLVSGTIWWVLLMYCFSICSAHILVNPAGVVIPHGRFGDFVQNLYFFVSLCLLYLVPNLYNSYFTWTPFEMIPSVLY